MKFLCQTDITYKQTKQTVKHCNNNRAICVCFVFFLSFELATSPSCNFQIEDVRLVIKLLFVWNRNIFAAMTVFVEQSTI